MLVVQLSRVLLRSCIWSRSSWCPASVSCIQSARSLFSLVTSYRVSITVSIFSDYLLLTRSSFPAQSQLQCIRRCMRLECREQGCCCMVVGSSRSRYYKNTSAQSSSLRLITSIWPRSTKRMVSSVDWLCSLYLFVVSGCQVAWSVQFVVLVGWGGQ